MTTLGNQLGSAALRYRPRPGDRHPGNRLPLLQTVRFGRQTVSRRARLEAVLFLASEPLTLRRLAQLANLQDATEARTLIEELGQLYDRRGCAFQVQHLAGGRQLLTREKLAPWVASAVPEPLGLSLTGPAMETLAVAAYRQPVLRAEVESIRGVQCGELLRQLMDKDLLRIVGRSEELGRPILYGTTKRFLQLLGLKSLEELPPHEELGRGLLAKQPEADGVSETTLQVEG